MGVCASKSESNENMLAESVFKNMIPEELFSDFAKCFERKDMPSGPIFDAGEDAEMYVITEGEVHVTIDITIDNKQSSILCVKDETGDTIGMLNTSGTSKQAVSAEAKGPCVLLRLDLPLYDTFSKANPEVATALGPVIGNMGAALSQIPFFKGIPEEQFTLIGNLLKPVFRGPNQALFHEGEDGQSMYMVISGSCNAVVNVVRGDHEQKEDLPKEEKVLATFHANDLLGEIALGLAIPRTASIISVEPSLFLELTADMFHDFKAIVKSSAVHIEKLVKRRTAEHFRRYKVPFFEAIPESKYAALASQCNINQHLEGEIIFKQGDTGDKFYMVTFGELKVTVENDGEAPKEVARLGPGKYFGEIALVQDTTRTATISAESRCILLSLNRKNFEKFFAEAPEAIADFEIKLAKVNCCLRSILYHPLGLEVFTKFCESEYSDENIKFWKLVHEYKHSDYSSYEAKTRAGYLADLEEKADEAVVTQNLGDLAMSVSGGAAPEEAFNTALACLAAVSGADPVTCSQLGITNPEDPAAITTALKASEAPEAKMTLNACGILEWGKVRDAFQDWANSTPGFLDDDEFEPAVQAVDTLPSTEDLNTAFPALLGSNDGVDLFHFTTYCVGLQVNAKMLQKDLETKAQHLWDQYVSASALEQVNVSEVFREVVGRAIAEVNIDRNTYNDTQTEVFSMMNRDSFPRFKGNEIFMKFLKDIGSYGV